MVSPQSLKPPLTDRPLGESATSLVTGWRRRTISHFSSALPLPLLFTFEHCIPYFLGIASIHYFQLITLLCNRSFLLTVLLYRRRRPRRIFRLSWSAHAISLTLRGSPARTKHEGCSVPCRAVRFSRQRCRRQDARVRQPNRPKPGR